PGEELVGRHPVELGEAEQPGNRDGPLAALVGAENRSLELLVGPGLHVVEREALLPADRAEAFADVSSVNGFHVLSSHAFPMPPMGAPGLTISLSGARHHSLRSKIPEE